MQNNETGPLFYITQKINLKWIKDLYVRPETIQFLNENAEEKQSDITFDNGFFGYAPKAQVTKAKMTKQGDIRRLPHSKGHHQPGDRQPRGREEVFQDHVRHFDNSRAKKT